MGARLVLLLLLAAACARPRDIRQPVPGAVERTVPDSTRYVLDAAATAITDEGLRVILVDRRHGLVESDWVDIALVKTLMDLTPYTEADRQVRFQFHTRPTFGGTRLVGEALYRPTGVERGRMMDVMVPADHPARLVLDRMLDRVETHLEAQRRKRAEEAARRRGAPPPPPPGP